MLRANGREAVFSLLEKYKASVYATGFEGI